MSPASRPLRLGHRQGNPRTHLRGNAPDRLGRHRAQQDAGQDRQRLAQAQRPVRHHAGPDRRLRARPARAQDLGRRPEERRANSSSRASVPAAICSDSRCRSWSAATANGATNFTDLCRGQDDRAVEPEPRPQKPQQRDAPSPKTSPPSTPARPSSTSSSTSSSEELRTKAADRPSARPSSK